MGQPIFDPLIEVAQTDQIFNLVFEILTLIGAMTNVVVVLASFARISPGAVFVQRLWSPVVRILPSGEVHTFLGVR